MATVTALETRNSRSASVKVRLDTGPAFSLSAAVVFEAGIREGQSISHHEIGRLRSADELHRSLNCALRIVGVRPRSEHEIRARLARRGFDAATIRDVIGRLRAQGLADDDAFARFWRDNRERFRPMAKRLLKLELRQKGIDSATLDRAVAGVDDETGAYRAAQKKSRSLTGLEYAVFRRRLGAFLKRRGFDYAIAARTIDRVWQEQ